MFQLVNQISKTFDENKFILGVFIVFNMFSIKILALSITRFS